MSAPCVATVGIATLDLVHRIDVFPKQPVKLRARSFSTSLGGMAAVAACTAACLGARAEFWGPTGDDAFGTAIRSELARAGVDTSALEPVAAASSSHSVVIVDQTGERLIINHRGSALAASAEVLPLQRLDAAAVLADVRWPAGAAAMLDRANAMGTPTVLDADTGELEALQMLVPRARHVIFSEPGFEQWAHQSADTPRGLERLLGLCAAGAELAAVTMGARGTIYATRERTGAQPAFAVAVTETLGAGDVFHGAYAFAMAERMPNVEALRFASAAAAIRCTRTGGLAALPRRPEVDAFLAANASSLAR